MLNLSFLFFWSIPLNKSLSSFETIGVSGKLNSYLTIYSNKSIKPPFLAGMKGGLP